jgi:hypothetical protein
VNQGRGRASLPVGHPVVRWGSRSGIARTAGAVASKGGQDEGRVVLRGMVEGCVGWCCGRGRLGVERQIARHGPCRRWWVSWGRGVRADQLTETAARASRLSRRAPGWRLAPRSRDGLAGCEDRNARVAVYRPQPRTAVTRLARSPPGARGRRWLWTASWRWSERHLGNRGTVLATVLGRGTQPALCAIAKYEPKAEAPVLKLDRG